MSCHVELSFRTLSTQTHIVNAICMLSAHVHIICLSSLTLLAYPIIHNLVSSHCLQTCTLSMSSAYCLQMHMLCTSHFYCCYLHMYMSCTYYLRIYVLCAHYVQWCFICFCHAMMTKGMVFRYTWVYSKEDTVAHTRRPVATS